jgi:anti-anti-sigma factor
MPYTMREEGGVLVFTFTGFLGHRDSYGFLEAVRGHVAAGAKRIAVSLEGVDKVNSSGIGVLAALVVSAGNAKASLRFACIPEHAWRIMTIVGLARVVENHGSVEEAIAKL